MELFYDKEHLGCPNYEKGPTPTMEVIMMSTNEIFSSPSHSCAIVVVLEGNVTYNQGTREERETEIVAGQMVLLLPNRPLQIKAQKPSKALLIRLKELVRFCEYYSIEKITRQIESSSMREELAIEKVHLLTVNEAMENFLSGVLMYLENGVSCKSLFDLKIKELFYQFRTFYPKEKLSLFFRNILSTDTYFSNFVVSNYRKHNTVTEFAAAANMTLWSFEQQFKKVFKKPAYQWMKERKANDIYHAICTERTPLKELAIRFGFSSKSSFSVFCRNNLGETPGELRRKVYPFGNKQQNQ